MLPTTVHAQNSLTSYWMNFLHWARRENLQHWNELTLSLWHGKKYDSSGVNTFLYYFCKSQSKVSKIPHNALLSISDLILDNWELWEHPFNHSRVGWGQISPFAINQLYHPHTSKRWHRKWQNSLFSIKFIQKKSKKIVKLLFIYKN